MTKPKTEQELAEPVIAWLESQYWDCYQEVELDRRRFLGAFEKRSYLDWLWMRRKGRLLSG